MIDAIIQQLTENCPALKSVEGAVDLAGLMESQFAVAFAKRPAAFVMFSGDRPGKNEGGTGPVVQAVSELATVTICLGDGTTGGKQAATDAIVTARNAVLASLLGFVPEPMSGELVYGGTQMLAMKPRTIWFQMSFTRLNSVQGG